MDRRRETETSGTIRTIGRLTSVLALSMILVGLTAGRAAAERPEAQGANTLIGFYIANGGVPDAWMRKDGSIITLCTFDGYTDYCHHTERSPDGACIIIGLGTVMPNPDDTGTFGETFHIDTRAATAPEDAALDDDDRP